MKKCDSAVFVCTSQQVEQLMGLGILPVGYFCYEFMRYAEYENEEDNHTEGYAFAGEYMGQDGAIPAWTLEELNVMIGGEVGKPDLLGKDEWTANTNMLQYVVYLPKVAKRFPNGAQAAAETLQFLIINNHVTVQDANDRMQAFVDGSFYNSQNNALEKAREEIQNGRKI